MTQSDALDVLKLGFNVFLTGEPGAGKTYTLNKFISHLTQSGISIGITASTGIAATHIGGMTIHSWSGLGIKDAVDERALEKLMKRPQLASRFRAVRVLIIDEISMMDGSRLDAVDAICRAFKKIDKPFGGLQVVLCGDLFQLPPITPRGQEIDYVHHSDAWHNLDLKICYLTEQHRQSDDTSLLQLLREIRRGEVSEGSTDLLQERLESEVFDDDVTRLYTHNANVDELNNHRLAEIDSEPSTFQMQTNGSDLYVESLKKSCLAPEFLELKPGAQVLFVANNPSQGYMNGTRGVVVRVDDDKPVVMLPNEREITVDRASWPMHDNDKKIAEINQYPLRLAWAITVHKSQGMSLDTAEIDLSRAFTPGMGYVALSRLRTLDGLYLRGANRMALAIDPVIEAFDKTLLRRSAQLEKSLQAIEPPKLRENQQKAVANLQQLYAQYDKVLYENLKSWRTEEAKRKSVPPYIIFDDKALITLAAEKPTSKKQLLLTSGFGPKKVQEYGEDVLRMVRQASGQLL